ncbi:hypothetical protein [Actinoalloteichus hymeniacidonis]|uniref:Uncharacterized protein n=1 Tax=Actinoalloteichus hymeniacidonis TaxID=340345 RepID=A0AAC9HVL9_9PSEU|nr:hypothetical protein [Actinoalloteichus hymeniacidonis]AOS65826.1 hypothetical protein TL08_25240 [Actinoalloteichus hymeniacidonis]MBB5906083.1 putative membrane protein YhdT [Actinoalloteichus hymeniacidonis]
MTTQVRRSSLFPLALATFSVGLLAVLVTFVLFAFGYSDQPVWLNLACLLAPVGMFIGVIALLLQSRRRARPSPGH